MTAPKLRFYSTSGYSYKEWQELELGDLVEPIKSGRSNKLDSGKYPLYGSTGLIGETNDAYTFESPVILAARVGSVGTINLSVGTIGVSDNTLIIKNKANSDIGFLYQLLKHRVDWHDLSNGTSQSVVAAKKVERHRVSVCSLEEQKKIAAFFSALDKKIDILDKRILKTELLSKALMDAIFNQKLQLKGSDGLPYPEWRNSTIGEEGKFHYGKSAPKWSLSEDASTPCVRYGDLYTKYSYVVDLVDTFTNIDPKDLVFSKGGEVLVPRVGEEPLDFCKCAYMPFPDVAIGEMVSVYETDNDGLFISFYFNSQMKHKFAKLVEGGNVSNLYYTYLEDIAIKIPSIHEQKEISELLLNIVRKIENLKQQKEAVIKLKKGFMQRMFV